MTIRPLGTFPDPYAAVRGTFRDPAREQDGSDPRDPNYNRAAAEARRPSPTRTRTRRRTRGGVPVEGEARG